MSLLDDFNDGYNTLREVVDEFRYIGKGSPDSEEAVEKGIEFFMVKDFDTAFLFFEEAAKKKHMGAQFALGQMYEDGHGVEQSDRKAFYWYEKAARQNHAGAQCNLGSYYYNGTGTMRSKSAAKHWFKKSAELGNDVASRNLNNLFGGGGCYVATCIYGSYDCPEVWTLRRYRDGGLSNSWFGRLFIGVYYAVSPMIVKLLGGRKWFNGMCKPVLDKFVRILQNSGIDSSHYSDM